MNDNDPTTTITIKVTDGEAKAYFVHFDRDSHDLIDVCEVQDDLSPRRWAAYPPATRSSSISPSRGSACPPKQHQQEKSK